MTGSRASMTPSLTVCRGCRASGARTNGPTTAPTSHEDKSAAKRLQHSFGAMVWLLTFFVFLTALPRASSDYKTPWETRGQSPNPEELERADIEGVNGRLIKLEEALSGDLSDLLIELGRLKQKKVYRNKEKEIDAEYLTPGFLQIIVEMQQEVAKMKELIKAVNKGESLEDAGQY